MTDSSGATEGATLAKAGKYLIFRLEDGEYGLEIMKVQEIIGIQSITRVPGTPHFVRGVINLRGRVIPVVSLRRRFGLPDLEGEGDSRACIIVVHVSLGRQSLTMGIIGDAVSEVLDISADEIEPPPSLSNEPGSEYLLGLGKISSKVVMLLDIESVLNAGGIQELVKNVVEQE